jgi:hypothetical protein
MTTKENLQKVLDQITCHGRKHFNMDWWFAVPSGRLSNPYSNNHRLDEVILQPNTFNDFLKDCGTTACLGGHAAVALAKQLVDSSENGIMDQIVQLLGLPNNSFFFFPEWEGRLLELYNDLDNEYDAIVTYLRELIDNAES